MNTVLLSQMAQLFIMIVMGYLLYKLKYFTVELNQKLTRLLLDVTLPLLIISSVMNTDVDVSGAKIGSVFLISFCMYGALSIVSIIVIKLLRFPKSQQGLYMFMHTFANTAFMGFPIINAVFGSEAMIYTAILNIFFNLFVFTVGIMMVNYDEKMEGGIRALGSLLDTKSLISTGTIGSLLAIVIYFLPVTFPEVITGVCHSIGGLTSPLAMLLIGATLSRIPVNNIFNDWRVYLFTIVKQIVVPVLAWPLMKLVIADDLIRSVMFILFLMPVANAAVLFATRFEKDEELAAKTVFVTTLISIATIPGVLSLLHVLG